MAIFPAVDHVLIDQMLGGPRSGSFPLIRIFFTFQMEFQFRRPRLSLAAIVATESPLGLLLTFSLLNAIVAPP